MTAYITKLVKHGVEITMVAPSGKPPKTSKTIRCPEFAARLARACDDSFHAPSLYHGRQSWIRRELMTRFDEKVSAETVRKWFAGEAKPVQHRVRFLAELLGVGEAWLALGLDPASSASRVHVAETPAQTDLSTPRGVFMLQRLRERLGGTVKVAPGVDLTAPTGEIWDAEG